MPVVAERVVAPHGWLRYDFERIRSVRHLTDPEHRPGPGVRPRGVWILCEALSGPEAQHGVELDEVTRFAGYGLTGFTGLPVSRGFRAHGGVLTGIVGG